LFGSIGVLLNGASKTTALAGAGPTSSSVPTTALLLYISYPEVNMGLDMYAYTAAKEQADYETSQREIAYWRKHPNLHGWMEKLAESKNVEYSTFNGVELELTWEDLDNLERAITHGQLPSTQGFFFGNEADDFYKEQDLEFVRKARAELFLGLKVFYNSSW
tara:strand:+ start:498 stop:983 length:486 start_codon:yes stop_codon:yes gene_type:complete